MTTIIASHGIKATIGAQDWSAFVKEFTCGYQELDTGAIATTGQLILGLPSVLSTCPSDPRFELNAAQWKRGQTVQIQVKNAAGTFVDHPLGKLHIIGEVEMAIPGTDFTLDLGCDLIYANSPQKESDQSGVVIGTSRARNTVIDTILGYLGLTRTISAMSYPFNYPLPSTNFIQQAAAIARANNQFLYQNSAGSIINSAIDFAQGSAYATFTVGTNEVIWEPSSTGELPAESTVLSATYYNPTLVYSTSTKTLHGARIDVRPTESSSPRTVITTQYVSFTDGGFAVTAYNDGEISTTAGYSTTTLTTEVPMIVVYPAEPTTWYQLTTSMVEFNQDVAAPDGTNPDGTVASGMVQRHRKLRQEPRIVIYPSETVNRYTLTDPSYVETVDYTYHTGATGSVGRVKTRITKVKDCRYRINAITTPSPYTLEVVSRVTETWSEAVVGSGEWTYVADYETWSYSAGTYSLVAGGGPFGLAGDTNNAEAPTPNYVGTRYSQPELTLTTTIAYTPPGGAPSIPRTENITVDYVNNATQLADYGATLNKLIVGRRGGRRIGFALTDLWLSANVKPLLRIDVSAYGQTYKLLADGLTYHHTQNEAYVIANGVYYP